MKYVLALVFIFLMSAMVEVMAQMPAPVMPGAPDQAPVDGGITVLALAGGAYAIRKLYQEKSK